LASQAEIGRSLLALDKGIRAVLWVEGTDDIQTVSREGLSPAQFIVPWNVWRLVGSAWIQVISGVASRIGEYAGKVNHVVFDFEKFDLLMVNLPSGDFVLTVDKGVRIGELAKKIIQNFRAG